MSHSVKVNINRTARITGWSMIAVLAIGMASSFLISHGIDINLSADVIGTSENMLAAEMRLRAKAYLALFMFALDILILVGLFYVLAQRESGAVRMVVFDRHKRCDTSRSWGSLYDECGPFGRKRSLSGISQFGAKAFIGWPSSHV